VNAEPAPRQGFTRAERQDFARRRILLPTALLVGVLALYLSVLLLVLAAPPAVSLALSVPCGLAIGMLFIIGHDACHNAYTASTRVNQVIGRLAFLPALHSFSLWDLAHNRTHHRFNNIRGIDYVWEPMTPAAYRGASWPQRLEYRFCRDAGRRGVLLPYPYLGAAAVPAAAGLHRPQAPRLCLRQRAGAGVPVAADLVRSRGRRDLRQEAVAERAPGHCRAVPGVETASCRS
jgi:Fatty acid desaturase